MGNRQLNPHQTKAVEALKQLKKICDEHGLTLYLLAGSALGAVREHGMILWDDDIDVGLTYEDWYKLRRILPKELDNAFEYIDYDVDKAFPRFHAKILYERRNCVDIFLISKWTESKFSGFFHWQLRKFVLSFYQYSLGYSVPIRPNKNWKELLRYKLVKAIRKGCFLLTKPFLKTKDFVAIAKWNESFFENSAYDCYINLYSVYSMNKELLKKEWIENKSVVVFEGEEYITVGDTDSYLRHLYGDYLIPPPVEKRSVAHAELF